MRHFTHGLLHFLVRLACVRHAASVDSEPGSNSRLKPDVCRRVVGRLPSPHIQSRLQKPLWFQQRGMAPPLSFAPSEEGLKTAVVYLVRSLGLLPESLSHDWHVQPSCQRPNRGPPERCEFSPGELAQVQIRLSSKPYKHTVRRKILSTPTSHRLSTRFAHGESSHLGRVQESSPAAQKQIPHDKTVRNDKPLSAELVYSTQQYGLPLWLK